MEPKQEKICCCNVFLSIGQMLLWNIAVLLTVWFYFYCGLLSFQHEDNRMDIREYVIALSVVCRPAKTLETMKLAFKVRFMLIWPTGRIVLCFTSTSITFAPLTHLLASTFIFVPYFKTFQNAWWSVHLGFHWSWSVTLGIYKSAWWSKVRRA